MSQHEKELERLKSLPKDYTYDEAKSLLKRLGFVENNKGKTSGSRVCFYRKEDNRVINLHKPHPQPIMKVYAVKELKEFLKRLEKF